MSVFNTEDLKSELNTIYNKTDESMEVANISSSKNSPPKYVLKTSNSSFTDNENRKDMHDTFFNHIPKSDIIPRPHTLEDFIVKEKLTKLNNAKATLALEELSADEEIWVIDIPRTIDPLQLKGQTLQLGDKSKFRIGDDRYCAINRESKSSLTCIFNTDTESGEHKAVNIRPAGMLSIRRKLSGTSKKKIEFELSQGVPYPKNVKIRHPFFGVQMDESVKQEKNVNSNFN